MELGINDKLAHIEATLSKLADSINTSRGSPSINNNTASSRLGREVSIGRPQHFQSKESTDDQKVVLASFHLEGEANQWWQWLRRSYQDEGKVVTWEVFVEELWARFGPTYCEYFDEALSRVKQIGTLRDYQKEFERLGNRVQGWTQKALVGTFMGGLKLEISEEIRLFRPRTLKEAISLARMRDEQLTRQRRLLRSPIFTRSPTAQTMRVKAKIGPHEIIVLVDSGSTHNFINSRLANMLQLPVQPTSAFPVKVANREKVICQGKHDKVHVLIQDIPFELTLYSLPITGLDVVLGVQWLESLGSVVCNWKQLTMDFDWDNAKRRLQGLDPQTIQATTLSEVTKDMKQGHNVFAICLYLNNEESYAVASANMRSLLEEYSKLFVEPKQLPPTREIDHQITLKEGTKPINVRSYRYAYFQKAETERQVNEMLSSGLIRPSTSPFSLPVFLVKKKNGSWRFCIDYRALNEATVKDRFPIPTVEDMLDELRGAAFFTKLDLRAGYHQASKCNFGQQELEYLGHIVTCHGVKVDEWKITAMVSWPKPWNITELRGFLGLTRYYRKFVRGYGLLARPLTTLLKKGQFGWNTKAATTFEQLKLAMTQTPVLSMPNFNDVFVIETDASGDGIGAKIATPDQQQWMVKLMGYDYEIRYCPGKENAATDALSRRTDSPTLNHLFVPQVSLWGEIKKAMHEDDYLKKIAQQAETQPDGPYTAKNGLIFFKGRKTKSETLQPAGLLQSLPVPCQVWEDISLDFIEGLPNSQGRDTIFVIVDRLSKYAHFLSLSHPFTAKSVAERFVDRVVKLHGMPKSIWPRKWNMYLSWAEFWYNTTFHVSTRMTPFQALYGRPPPSAPMYSIGSSPVHEVNHALQTRDELLRQLKSNLVAAANQMKQTAYKKRRDVEFKEGDMVYLRLHPYRQSSVFKRAHQKLCSRYFGPYQIIQKVGHVAYKLQLPEGAKVHSTFHVSVLKKAVGDSTMSSTELPPIDDEGVLDLEPRLVLDTRWLKRGGNVIEQSLIQWNNLPMEEATWEDTAVIKQQFPSLALEDKGPLPRGSDDKKLRRTNRVAKPNSKYMEYAWACH
ncbi:hypothetical protein KPL70_025802 [Citrus sinensis]|nr:hypothetical protein KPL70_025802 [Citrus sinensis]